MTTDSLVRSEQKRLGVVLVALAILGTMLLCPRASDAVDTAFPSATPKALCGPGARPEGAMQGRVPTADYTNGRAAKGYECNVSVVSHQGASGGFKVHRYTDAAGHTCAYYDSTTMFGKDVLFQVLRNGLGVIVLDMTDPAKPKQTATLKTVAMLSPHESLLLHTKRGLLAAVAGSPATAPGILDIYDVKTDCRYPKLLSTGLRAPLGHESGWSPDGNTFYAAGAAGSWTAIDVTDPKAPKAIFSQYGEVYHGLRLSPDGRTMYVANIGAPSGGTSGLLFSSGGLRILDVSEIQDRKPNPQVRIISGLTWREHSIPQSAEPFVKDGHKYVLETDEYANFGLDFTGLMLDRANVGAARIINVDDPRRPFVVSNLRLAVHQPANRVTAFNDPGANLPVQGYAGHYCSVDKDLNPNLVACSMIVSGLRVFNISNVKAPREVAYFNHPTATDNLANPLAIGAFAMSRPAWDVARQTVWYTDANNGFWAIKLTNGAGSRP